MSPAGTVVRDRFSSVGGGAIESLVYLPHGYATSDRRYPTLYLLHGHGDSASDWIRCVADWDALIDSGDVPAFIAVMIDGPWSERGSWWVDSHFSGSDGHSPEAPVEKLITSELVPHIDGAFRTQDRREARWVGGYSMGGAGALRYATTHQSLFSLAIVMSAAVYVPQPPLASSTRSTGAFGKGAVAFDAELFAALNYPTAFERVDSSLPIALFIIVGDREWIHPDPDEAHHDLDFESATLFNAARRVRGVSASLRVVDGGHDWHFWRRALRCGLLGISL